MTFFLTKVLSDVKWETQQRICCVYCDYATIWRKTAKASITVLFLCCIYRTRKL